MAKLSGRSLIGFREGKGSAEPLYATDPTTGQRLQPGFISATAEEVELAARLASISAGTRAIFRFTRAVCYQGFPDDALPEGLKDPNPVGIWRLHGGRRNDPRRSRSRTLDSQAAMPRDVSAAFRPRS